MYNDAELLRTQRAFLFEVEQGIRVANREIIHAHIPEITRESVFELAVVVARLRASYLEAAFELARTPQGEPPEARLIAELRIRRETYEESREAFSALQRAIEVGYVDLSKIPAK